MFCSCFVFFRLCPRVVEVMIIPDDLIENLMKLILWFAKSDSRLYLRVGEDVIDLRPSCDVAVVGSVEEVCVGWPFDVG